MTTTPPFEGHESVVEIATLLSVILPVLEAFYFTTFIDLAEIIEKRYGGDEAEKDFVVGLATGFKAIYDAMFAYEDRNQQ